MPSRWMKKEEWPQPHYIKENWQLSAETADKTSTQIAIAHYDEGLGASSANESNPRNPSFAVQQRPNCWPNSKIDSVFANLRVQLTKGAIETDKISSLRIAFQTIALSFDDALAIDELSQLEIQDTLHLSRETTDRQTYPLYNGTKLTELYSGSATLSAAVPGLTTTQVLEGDDFAPFAFYSALQYHTTKEKLKVCQNGLHWRTLTKNKPYTDFRVIYDNKAKKMMPYTYFGLRIFIAEVGTWDSGIPAADTTAIDHVTCNLTARYLERNPDFNHAMI